MGGVSYEIFETYNRKKDLDEAISFFEEAKRRQEDQEVFLVLGNVVECCIDGILRAKGSTKKDKETYQEKAKKELKLMRERLDDVQVDKTGLNYIFDMAGDIRKKDDYGRLTWLAPYLDDLEENARRKEIDVVSSGVSVRERYPMKRRNRLASALACLALLSCLAGFQIFQSASGAEPGRESISGYYLDVDSMSRYHREAWKEGGLHIYNFNNNVDKIELIKTVTDWSAVQIRDYDIDVVTS